MISEKPRSAACKAALMSALALCLCCSASPLMAQVALVGGEVHTVSGEVIAQGVVVVGKDGTITAVGPAGTGVPAGHERIDVSGKVVTPGLFDAYSSVGLVEIWAVKASRDNSSGAGVVSAGHRASESFNVRSAVLPVQREGGVTDVHVVPDGSVVHGQSAHVELHGPAGTFAAIQDASVALTIELGAGAASALKTSRGGVFAMLRELYADARFYLANVAKYNERRSRELLAKPGDLQAIAQTFEGKKPVLFVANRASDIEAALAFAAEQKIRPVIVGGAQAWMVRELLAAQKVPVILEAMNNLPDNFEMLGARADNIVLLHAAGVPVVLSAFESHNVRKLRQQAGNAVRSGLPHAAALRAVTLEAAMTLGKQKTHGSLEVGKVGNVVVWSGDPFEFSSRVEVMLVRGERVSLESRQSVLLERYRELERRAEPAAQEAAP